MPAYSKEREQYHISRVKSVMILAPDAGLEQIQEALEASTQDPLRLDRDYISKIRRKIYAERLQRNNNLNKGARIAYIQDKKKAVEQRLWGEATNMKNPGVVRVMALEKIVKNELDLLKAEMDAGLYERQIGTVKVSGEVEHQHTHVLVPEVLDPIMRAFRNYGLIKEVENEYATKHALPGAAGGAPHTDASHAEGTQTAVPGI